MLTACKVSAVLEADDERVEREIFHFVGWGNRMGRTTAEGMIVGDASILKGAF